MSGVALTIDTQDIEQALARLQRWADRVSLSGLYDAMGTEVESQSRRRIEDERTAPSGRPWRPWSPGYAATRDSGHNLLQNEGDLVDSLGYQMTGARVEIGTELDYGAKHQFGLDGLPVRPFLGLSEENAEDVLSVVQDWLDQELRRL